MTMNSLDWYSLSRESAPGVLLGVEVATGSVEAATRRPSSQPADLMVGIDANSLLRGATTPCIALVASSQVAELFAWLHTYSHESFPISQFCRVETTESWDSLLSLDGMVDEFPSVVWASIITGEMLANAEQRPELKAVPLSWAAGCFSYTMARVLRVNGRRSDVTRDAAARLRTVEAESRFARRRLSVDVLSAVWAIAASGEKIESDNVRDVANVVLSALDREGSALLRDNDKLGSNSAEQRIHGFDEFVDTVLASQRRRSRPDIVRVGALLAGAALIAGGGTSHIDLLKPYIDEYPDCLPWFGLLAGFAGPRSWDSDWLRLVKGVERQIRGGFQPTDPLQSDLCWMEFDWLRQLSKSPSVFIDLTKHHNRLLILEVLPGATYQARLVAPPSDARVSQVSEPKSGAAQARNAEATYTATATEGRDWLPELIAVSDQLQTVLRRLTEGNSSSSRFGQAALFGDAGPAKIPKRPSGRAKKGTPGT